MTKDEQRAWDAKIHALKQAGVGMPERAERARHGLAAEAAARAESETPTPPAAEPRVARDNGKPTEPETTEQNGDERTEGMVNSTTTATATGTNSQASPKPARHKTVKGKRRGGRPAKAEGQGADNVHARLIDAAAAARMCGVSKSGWWAFHAAGRCPLPVRLGRATRWRQDELSDWIDAGCPMAYMITEDKLIK